jgi:phosphohistidine phosphatase
MKTLYLLRHAKAEAGSRELSDRNRPLSPRGQEACVAIGAYMKKRDYKPALVLSSPSVRTLDTSIRVREAADIHIPEREIDKLYLATADEILYYVRLVSDKLPSAMVVGHNPGMHHAALDLAKPERTELRRQLELKYPTGTLTVLRFDVQHWQDIAKEKGEIIDFASPQSVKD